MQHALTRDCLQSGETTYQWVVPKTCWPEDGRLPGRRRPFSLLSYRSELAHRGGTGPATSERARRDCERRLFRFGHDVGSLGHEERADDSQGADSLQNAAGDEEKTFDAARPAMLA